MNKQQAWQPPPPPPPPPYTPPPSYSTPPPYPQPPRSGQPRSRLRRSRTDRRIAGVAGGLGEYLGVDATALRVGFVIASILFLGGLGGPVLYVIAWILVPEEGKDAPVTRAAFSGRVWHDWDRSARSWALVLGALALAFIWSFGLWPWWHWRTLPVWLLGLALTLWILARHRESNLGLGGPSGTVSPPGPGGPMAPPGGSPVPPQPAPFVPTEDPDRPRPNTPVTGSPVTPAAPYEPAPYEADPPPAAAFAGGTAPPANGLGSTSSGAAPGSALADQPTAIGHTAWAAEAITTVAETGPAAARPAAAGPGQAGAPYDEGSEGPFADTGPRQRRRHGHPGIGPRSPPRDRATQDLRTALLAAQPRPLFRRSQRTILTRPRPSRPARSSLPASVRSAPLPGWGLETPATRRTRTGLRRRRRPHTGRQTNWRVPVSPLRRVQGPPLSAVRGRQRRARLRPGACGGRSGSWLP